MHEKCENSVLGRKSWRPDTASPDTASPATLSWACLAGAQNWETCGGYHKNSFPWERYMMGPSWSVFQPISVQFGWNSAREKKLGLRPSLVEDGINCWMKNLTIKRVFRFLNTGSIYSVFFNLKSETKWPRRELVKNLLKLISSHYVGTRPELMRG